MKCDQDGCGRPPTIQALVQQVLDAFLAAGKGCRARLDPPARGARLLEARLAGPAELKDIRIENAKARLGCCLRAVIHATLQLCLHDGCGARTVCVALRLPVSGVFRSDCEKARSFAVCLDIGGVSLDLEGCGVCFDYKATLYALAPTVVRLPCPVCPPDCSSVFSLPLYPR